MDDQGKKKHSDPEVISTEEQNQAASIATPTPEAKNTELKPLIELAATGRTVQNRQYHPGFVCACKLVWDPKKLKLVFFDEHAVTVEPIKTDLFILKQDPDVVIPDRIGSFFRTYNFIQFKSENDTFRIRDLLKELGYAFLYQDHHSDFNLEDCSITVFCSHVPVNTLRFLTDHGFTIAHNSEDPNIMYVGFELGVKMQVVVVGNLLGKDNEYAPFNMFSGDLDDDRVLNLAKFKDAYIQSEDEDRLEQYEAILKLLYDKKPEIMIEIINHLKEANHMSQEQLCVMLFPEVLDAERKAAEKKGVEKEKENMLDWMLRNIRNLALKHHSTFEDALQDYELPEWCSREEALKRMYAM